MIQAFTKRRMIDIKDSENTIDVEYLKRLQTMKGRQDFIDIIKDYEEFLPSELQKFRNCDEDEFKEMIFQVRRFVQKAMSGQPMPADPTEAVMFMMPPLLTIPRGYASQWNKDHPNGKPMTWGMAWREFASKDWIAKITKQCSNQIRQIIKIKNEQKEQINEWIDTRS